ncbi:hypothetical protein DACRYDRAFT_111391 [Dacryopinax primogenitus]|uniref:F-box domain-containing protein n=1 Tax=Dacryopinax primogenitus (strain DJM 731) TaxID=1858805 RepID=M5FQP4_DACPD|nr:uncharacterized protein DACRYDRAFT_111391 [Dacryopinax primogenitus]EJT97873.1 hypothetical protein DACRYDRAFT_111391 [Dacryopinax primogenitus]
MSIFQQPEERVGPAFKIPEVLDSICVYLDDPDLVKMACASKSFTDVCMKILWESPVFDGSPLVRMSRLFPEDVGKHLGQGLRPGARIPPGAFERFDYYAGLIRSLHLWHPEEEAAIARVLTDSRPGLWLFPGLVDLDLGASTETLRTAPFYFSPSILSLRLNHWDLNGMRELSATEDVKRSLLRACAFPKLEKLDLADALYTRLENDGDLVEAFTDIARRVYDCRALSFLTVPGVFAALAGNMRLHTVYLNLVDKQRHHEHLHVILSRLRDDFIALRKLGLACSAKHAVRMLQETRRAYEHIDLQVDTPIEGVQLHEIAVALFLSSNGLRYFRLLTSAHLFCDVDPPLRLSEAFQPLQSCRMLKHFELALMFDETHMMRDVELVGFFRLWPELRVFVLRCDTDGDRAVGDDDEGSYSGSESLRENGITLFPLTAAARHCPRLHTLSLPFVQTSEIPSTEGIERVDGSVAIRLNKSHVHNHQEVGEFMARLWRETYLSLGGCVHLEGMTMRL